MITNIDELTQNEAVAYFRADLCLSDPDNYTLDEKREICEQMDSGNSATFTFLTIYDDYVPEVDPEDFDVCPIMLAQPEDDRWTPQHLAELTLKKIAKVPVRREVLRHGSHYPIERTALEDLRRHVLDFLDDNLRYVTEC